MSNLARMATLAPKVTCAALAIALVHSFRVMMEIHVRMTPALRHLAVQIPIAQILVLITMRARLGTSARAVSAYLESW